MVGKLKQKGLVRVAVYLNKEELTSMARVAEKLGLRRVGLPTETLKSHGFEGETEANTDGVSKVLKFCFEYWMKEEPKRLKRKAEIKQEIMCLEKEDIELG